MVDSKSLSIIVVVGVVDSVENSPFTSGKRGVSPVDNLWIIAG